METPLGLWAVALASAIFGAVHTFNFIGSENGAQRPRWPCRTSW